jgi:hypothetical protein
MRHSSLWGDPAPPRQREAGAIGATEGTAPARAGLVLAALILVAGVANLDLSVANVALPDIGGTSTRRRPRWT